MNILVLDDLEGRVSWLAEVVGHQHLVCWAPTVKRFSELYPTLRWDLIVLDHDLGETDRGHDGTDAVQYLDPEASHTVLVWSANPVGAQNIVFDLRRHGIGSVYVCPFEVDKIKALMDFLLSYTGEPSEV